MRKARSGVITLFVYPFRYRKIVSLLFEMVCHNRYYIA